MARMHARSHACFKCEQCGAEELVQNVVGHIEEPKRCANEACRANWSLKMVHNRSLFLNKQIVKMQVRRPGCPPRRRVLAAMKMHWDCSEMRRFLCKRHGCAVQACGAASPRRA